MGKTIQKEIKKKIDPFFIFGKATEISFNLVFFPVILLFLGLFIDKKFHTTPVFILSGCVLGFVYAVYRASKLKNLMK